MAQPFTSLKSPIGIYPLPSRRLARDDEYPDFFFHPQIYRKDGEHVYLPPGVYDVLFTRGPEYIPQSKQIRIPRGLPESEVLFQLKRWVHMAKLGWYSADHHIHAAGCSHYENPAQGVSPEHIWRQALGEDLNVACVLTWGPGLYHQKKFFEGAEHSLSTESNILRYDVEVSGFPSSHAGHLCLLRLQEDDYPGTRVIEDWPSWTLPVLKWGKSQGAVVGYAHSGWGLEPVEPTQQLPNYVMAKFNGIGANEYIVTVTHGVVDFISAGDTVSLWELNIWYHTLNCGFRTRISGETDFPCIFDDRVGMARTYARLDGRLNFDEYAEKIRMGRSYVSDGRSHIIDFSVNGVEIGVQGSELDLPAAQKVRVSAKAVAYLSERPDGIDSLIAASPLDQKPYWHIERARIGKSRKVPIELILNGKALERRELIADGTWQDLSFDTMISQSSWLALRVFPSSHTNPVFVLLNSQPIRSSKRSAEWCREAVDQCWKMKRGQIREKERSKAAKAYQHARWVYDQIIREASR